MEATNTKAPIQKSDDDEDYILSYDQLIEGSNLYRNYYAKGLTTVETIGPRYAESGEWVGKINWYVGKLKSA